MLFCFLDEVPFSSGCDHAELRWEALGAKAFGSWCPPCFRFLLLILRFFFLSFFFPKIGLGHLSTVQNCTPSFRSPLCRGFQGFGASAYLAESSVCSLEKLSLPFTQV